MNEQSPVIVLVDDDRDFLDINENLLSAAGYAIVCFTDREEAFEYMRQTRPALVISDLMMENLDSGFSLARRIKSEPVLAGVPVIILTAIGSQRGFNFRPRTEEELEAICADAYFDKPAPADQLLAKVQELIG